MSEPHFDFEREAMAQGLRGPCPIIGAHFGSRERKMLFEKGRRRQKVTKVLRRKSCLRDFARTKTTQRQPRLHNQNFT